MRSISNTVSVCPFVRWHISKTAYQNFTTFLADVNCGPVQYVMYFRFCGWRHILNNRPIANWPESKKMHTLSQVHQLASLGRSCYLRLKVCYVIVGTSKLKVYIGLSYEHSIYSRLANLSFFRRVYRYLYVSLRCYVLSYRNRTWSVAALERRHSTINRSFAMAYWRRKTMPNGSLNVSDFVGRRYATNGHLAHGRH